MLQVWLGPLRQARLSRRHDGVVVERLRGVAPHTMLVFSDGADKIGRVVSALKAYPSGLGLLRVVLIRADTSAVPLPSGAVYLSVLDRDGYAHEGYQVQKGGFTVIIVRPDGIIGGIFFGLDGAMRYLDGLFNALAKLSIRGSLQTHTSVRYECKSSLIYDEVV